MKIGIPATSPNLDAKVENRLGTAAYLLVIDLDDLSFESAAGPSSSAGPAAGIEAISLLTRMGAKTILTGYISPNIELTLRKSGIEVITPVRGTVLDALEKYRQGTLSKSLRILNRTFQFSHTPSDGNADIQEDLKAVSEHYPRVGWCCFAGGAFPWFHVPRLTA